MNDDKLEIPGANYSSNDPSPNDVSPTEDVYKISE